MAKIACRRRPEGDFCQPRHAFGRVIDDAIRGAAATLPNDVQFPQVLTTMAIRGAVRRLVATTLPWLQVIAYQDVRPDTIIQPIGRIALDGLTTRAQVTVDGEPLWSQGQR